MNSTASYGIYFINENTGWGVGYDSKIFKTTTGGGGLIGIEPISAEIPHAFVLKQNYPNPFNPQTKINFDLPKALFAELTIYDILGRQISVLFNEHLNAGKYSVDFDGSNMPSGVYFYRLKTGDFSQSRKMILIK